MSLDEEVDVLRDSGSAKQELVGKTLAFAVFVGKESAEEAADVTSLLYDHYGEVVCQKFYSSLDALKFSENFEPAYYLVRRVAEYSVDPIEDIISAVISMVGSFQDTIIAYASDAVELLLDRSLDYVADVAALLESYSGPAQEIVSEELVSLCEDNDFSGDLFTREIETLMNPSVRHALEVFGPDALLVYHKLVEAGDSLDTASVEQVADLLVSFKGSRFLDDLLELLDPESDNAPLVLEYLGRHYDPDIPFDVLDRYLRIFDHIDDKELAFSLDQLSMENLLRGYDVCVSQFDSESSERIIDMYFSKLNRALAYGSSLDQKQRIFDEYCTNVYSFLLRNPDALDLLVDE